MEKFYCKYCGIEYPTVRTLTSAPCTRSPSKKHELYEGSKKSQYTCKHCGIKYPTIRTLTGASCTKSPTKRHEPAL